MGLFHLTTGAAWAQAEAEGVYRAPSLLSHGFIHLSDEGQWLATANRFYRGHSDLVLLVIEPDRLEAQLRWEDGVPPAADGSPFPHLYGPLNLGAVVQVLALPVDGAGAIVRPEGLSG